MELIRLIVVDYMTLSTIQTSSTTLKKNALSDIVSTITCLGIHVRNKKKGKYRNTHLTADDYVPYIIAYLKTDKKIQLEKMFLEFVLTLLE